MAGARAKYCIDFHTERIWEYLEYLEYRWRVQNFKSDEAEQVAMLMRLMCILLIKQLDQHQIGHTQINHLNN